MVRALIPALAKTPFGKVDGRDVDLYTLTNSNGLRLQVMTYGAIVTSLEVPDRHGNLADVVLGFDTVDGYVKGSPYFGAIAGRIGNRIRNGKFAVDGQTYSLVTNDEGHHLHGGVRGWDKVVWTAEASETPDGPAIKLTHVSPDGDEGYPGTVAATVIYTLTNKNELRVAMTATTDRTTIVNMLHHSYWNLGGVARAPRPITDHLLTLHAARYTPGDPIVPTGAEVPVAGTPFDFTSAKTVGQDLLAVGGDPIGYDNNFIVDGAPDQMRPAARLKDPTSGRVMTIEADKPGIQFYCGKYLNGSILGKGGIAYQQYAGLCLETQAFPNAVNVPAWQGQVVLNPGQTYKHTMIHRFTAE
jgi:aldose 1-epimerase